MHQLATRIAGYLVRETKTKTPNEVLSYSIEVILNLLTQILILVIIGLVFKILPYIIAAVTPVIIFRTLSGGSHCSSFLNCTAISVIIFTLIGFLANKINIVPEIIASIYLILIFIVLKWAPVNTRKKLPSKRIMLFKTLSFTYLVITGLFCLFLLADKTSLVNAVVLGLAWQGLNLTPFGIKIIDKFDKIINFRRGVNTTNV